MRKVAKNRNVICAGGTSLPIWANTIRYACLITLAVCVFTARVGAVEIDWLGGDGAWEDSANWPGGVLPTDEDFVTLPSGDSVTSSGTTNIAEELLTHANLTILDGLFTVVGTIDAFADFVITPSAEVAAGRIFIQAAGLLDLQNNAAVNVVEGVFSSGLVDIRDSAILNAESFDNFNQWDVRSTGMAIANSMINHTGAIIDVTDNGTLFDINGNLTNNGTLNALSSSSADIDSIDNEGNVNISGGAQLTGNSVDNNSLVSVFGLGSMWQSGIVTNFSGTISVSDNATGTVGTVDNRSNIDVDNAMLSVNDGVNSASGTLELSNGASVDVANLFSNFGQINIDASSQLLSANFQQLDGETQLNGGTLGADDNASANIAGGTLIGNGAINGDLAVTLDGILDPDGGAADPTALLTISDELLLDGLFNVDLGGTANTDFDRLVVTNDAELGGTLNVELVGGFTPMLGDFFDIISAQNVTGDFDTLILPMLGNGLALEGINGGTFYRLQIIAAPVPVPSMLPLLITLLVGLGLRRRRPSP